MEANEETPKDEPIETPVEVPKKPDFITQISEKLNTTPMKELNMTQREIRLFLVIAVLILGLIIAVLYSLNIHRLLGDCADTLKTCVIPAYIP